MEPTTATIIAAAIGATTGLLSNFAATYFKENYFLKATEDRKKAFESNQIVSAYITPLALAAEKLFWRCNELFVSRRGHFLLLRTRPLQFNEYKRISTLYRLAVLLGWIRALEVELSFIRQTKQSNYTELNKGIEAIRSALADGPDVEKKRLENLCRIWKFEIPEKHDQAKLAHSVELKLYEVAGDALQDRSDLIKSFSIEDKLKVCKAIVELIANAINVRPLDEKVIGETVEQAIAALSYREAWIYRDWQDAIGDSMLHATGAGLRRYSVKNFREFVELLDTDQSKPWIKVYSEMIVDIDLEQRDYNDFRADQLERLAKSVAKLLLTLESLDEHDAVNAQAAEAAKSMIGRFEQN